MTRWLRSVFWIPLAFLAAFSVARAQGTVDRVGEETAARIDKIFTRYARRDCPGCSLGVAQNGRVIYARGYGMANLEYGAPITPATVFEAGSVSKQFTAGAIQILARQGKLTLDDDIRKYLPEVPDFGTRITIRNLLNHTSGLRDQWELLTLMGRPPGSVVHTLEEILDLVSRQKELNFPPGSEFLYSNTGFSLLAWIVRRASGMSLAEFSAKEIFQPLGMKKTQWREDYTRIVKERATAYSAAAQGEYRSNMSFTNVYGNGGLLTTPTDLLTWSENFENPRVIGREYLAQMQTPSTLTDKTVIGYGLALDVMEYRGLREINHGGQTAGYQAFLVRFPDQRLSVALLCNLVNVNPGILAHQVAEVFLEGKLKEPRKPRRIEVPPDEIKRFAGLYRNLLTDATLRISFVDGKLMLSPGNEIIPVEKNRFEGAGGIQYVFTWSPRLRLDVISPGEHPAVYAAVPAFAPSDRQLNEYAGAYVCEEIAAYFIVRIRDGSLILSRWLMPQTVLTPSYEEAFTEGTGTLRFTRNPAGVVDGLSYSSGRILHLRFVRRPG
jgi:CubicO group peptidase (beta-lactamase class C family)